MFLRLWQYLEQCVKSKNNVYCTYDYVAGDNAHPDQGVKEAAQKVQESLDTSTSSVSSSDQETSQRRKRVKDLFYAMDKDNNGKLDVGEFRGKKRFWCELEHLFCACACRAMRWSHIFMRALTVSAELLCW